ncbi:MAG: small multi-drug export protein [Aggregatilineales bacterium]
MLDYLVIAFGAWFLGFFPLAEIYVAVPAAVATGMDDISVIFWTVLGNFTPVLVITLFYGWLMRNERIKGWLTRFASEKVRTRVDRYGVLFVLLVTPWTGIWVMTVTARALGMNQTRFMLAAFVSIFSYAVIVLVLIRAGVAVAAG